MDAEDSAIQFHRRAISWEKEILKHSDHVIYVGGSTLHIQSLINPFKMFQILIKRIFLNLLIELRKKGFNLYNQLKNIDPDYVS